MVKWMVCGTTLISWIITSQRLLLLAQVSTVQSIFSNDSVAVHTDSSKPLLHSGSARLGC